MEIKKSINFGVILINVENSSVFHLRESNVFSQQMIALETLLSIIVFCGLFTRVLILD